MKDIVVIYHRADFDGIFCREIARKFLGDTAEYIGWDYGDPLVEVHSGCETLYVLDLSPECVAGMVACGGLVHPEAQKLVWIDHHKSTIEKFPGGVPGYRIDGVAACRLAWEWFKVELTPGLRLATKDAFVNRTLDEPYAVRLAGEYDIWDKRDPDAEVFQFGLQSMELKPLTWELLLGENSYDHAQNMCGWGRLCQQYQQRTDAEILPRGFLVEFEGLKFLALNTARCNSLSFAAKDVPETGHDALMGFYWTGTATSVSLYHARHRTDLDLSAIAVKYGGGGHRGACGFSLQSPAPEAPHLPFMYLIELAFPAGEKIPNGK